MLLSALWERFRGRRAGGFPLVLRVMDARGKPCRRVRIDGTWLPSGRSFSATPMVADGLCLVPWAFGAARLEATVTTEAGSGALSARRALRAPHPALELRLGQRR